MSVVSSLSPYSTSDDIASSSSSSLIKRWKRHFATLIYKLAPSSRVAFTLPFPSNPHLASFCMIKQITNKLVHQSITRSSIRHLSTGPASSSVKRAGVVTSYNNLLKTKPTTRSIAFLAAGSIAGGLSLALFNSPTGLSIRNSKLNILGNSFSTSSGNANMASKDSSYPYVTLSLAVLYWNRADIRIACTSIFHLSDLLYSVSKSDEEWRKGTEMAGTGEYDKHVRRHPFVCIIRTSLTC
jgi:hypothetical protein